MKDKFEQVYDLQKRNMTYSPWAKKTPLVERVNNIKEEVDEALEEAIKGDWEKFQDEIGDVLWDCLGAISSAEEKGYISIENVLDHIYQKFTTRKPYLLEGKKVTLDEERRLWQDGKDKQYGKR